MPAPTPVTHNTFSLERLYPASPERVFAALSDPAKKRRWYAEGKHHKLEQYELEFRVGGAERTLSRFGDNSPFPGVALSSEAVHLDIVANVRVVIAQTMAMGEKRFSAALYTFELSADGAGTKLLFTHQGAFFEGADGPEMREAGWRALLDNLAKEFA